MAMMATTTAEPTMTNPKTKTTMNHQAARTRMNETRALEYKKIYTHIRERVLEHTTYQIY